MPSKSTEQTPLLAIFPNPRRAPVTPPPPSEERQQQPNEATTSDSVPLFVL
jgi:hypothetical protein